MKEVHEVGDKVWYKNKSYIVINEDFDCGGNLHVLGLVRLYTNHPTLLRVRYADDREVEDYEEPVFTRF
jgi:hypothetical protein